MKTSVAGMGLLLVAIGCEGVSSDKIQLWKGTEKGPGKLQAALRDSKLAPQLRAEAAAAMVEISMADQVDAAMAEIPASERWEILKSYIPMQMAGMKDHTLSKAREYRDGHYSMLRLGAPRGVSQLQGT